MKKIIPIIYMLCLLAPAGLLAQGRPPISPEAREEVESMKIAFFTNKLQLTPDEAKTFWPAYNQFSNEIFELREAQRKRLKAGKEGLGDMSNQELEKMADAEIAFRQQEVDLLRKYHTQFKQILPMKKVILLYRAEEDFKRELIGRLRDRKKEGPPPHRKK